MHRYHVTMTLILAGVWLTLALPFTVAAQGQEKYTDFRGRAYSAEDLEKALFPETPRVRGIAPQRSQVLPPSRISVGLNVFFEFNSDKILPKYHTDLDKLGQVLTKRSESRFQIEGHTDSIGSESYNQTLSEKRARSVQRYLVQNFAIDDDRLVIRGYGEEQPRDTNSTPQGRRMNRRVEFVNLGN